MPRRVAAQPAAPPPRSALFTPRTRFASVHTRKLYEVRKVEPKGPMSSFVVSVVRVIDEVRPLYGEARRIYQIGNEWRFE